MGRDKGASPKGSHVPLRYPQLVSDQTDVDQRLNPQHLEILQLSRRLAPYTHKFNRESRKSTKYVLECS
jgi:hypothetical protein